MKPEHSLAAMMKPVQPGLARMREVLSMQVADASPAVRDMTDHVGRFQGKQLRGALVLLTGEATGNTTDMQISSYLIRTVRAGCRASASNRSTQRVGLVCGLRQINIGCFGRGYL